jgi:hypothetical protein
MVAGGGGWGTGGKAKVFTARPLLGMTLLLRKKFSCAKAMGSESKGKGKGRDRVFEQEQK